MNSILRLQTLNANSIFRLYFLTCCCLSTDNLFVLNFVIKSLKYDMIIVGQSKNTELKYYGSVLIFSVSPVRAHCENVNAV